MKAFEKLMVLLLLVICTSAIYAQEFVSPIGFVDNEANRKKVIAYIIKKASEEPSMQGISEQSMRKHCQVQIDAFKELALVKNTTMLQNIINSARSMKKDNYLLIWIMYYESDKKYVRPFEW